MLDKRVVEIARATRRWAMRNRERFDADEDLGGMCAIASGYMHRKLAKEGIRSRLAINDVHCFVLVGRYLVDVTATQFNGDDHQPNHSAICVEKLFASPYEYWWIDKRFNSVEALYRFQAKCGWPIEQRVLLKERMLVNAA